MWTGGQKAMRTSAKPLMIRAKFGRNLIIYGVKTALFLRVKHAILFLKKDSNVKVYAMDGVLWTSCPDSKNARISRWKIPPVKTHYLSWSFSWGWSVRPRKGEGVQNGRFSADVLSGRTQINDATDGVLSRWTSSRTSASSCSSPILERSEVRVFSTL